MNTNILRVSLNEKDLTHSFWESIKPLFLGKEIILTIVEKEQAETEEELPGATLKSDRLSSSLDLMANLVASKGTPGSSKGAGGGQPTRITFEY